MDIRGAKLGTMHLHRSNYDLTKRAQVVSRLLYNALSHCTNPISLYRDHKSRNLQQTEFMENGVNYVIAT